MIVTFDKEYLLELYETGKTTDKKHRFQPEIGKKYKFCIDALKAASGIEALFHINSLHYEILHGDKEGISSIRVNQQYRIEFTVKSGGSEAVLAVCNILDLSNHYK